MPPPPALVRPRCLSFAAVTIPGRGPLAPSWGSLQNLGRLGSSAPSGHSASGIHALVSVGHPWPLVAFVRVASMPRNYPSN